MIVSKSSSIRLLGLSILLALLSGCASTGSNSFREMSSAYRDVVEQYSNDNILLNIVRVSKNMPMSFLDIPSVVGSGTIVRNVNASATFFTINPSSVPGFFSPGNTANDTSNSSVGVGLSINNSFSFTQSSLDNSSFMTSFYREIPLDVLDFRGTERLRPRAIDYILLIDSIEGRFNEDKAALRVENDPLSKDYDHFMNVFRILMELGLRVEKVTTKTSVGPLFEESKSPAFLGINSVIDGIAKGVLSVDEITKDGKKYYQLSRIDSTTRLCVNKYRTQEIVGNLISKKSYCANSEKLPPSKEKFDHYLSVLKNNYPNISDLELRFKIRSTGNVFDFLGNVLLAQSINPNRKIMIVPSQTDLATTYAVYNKPTNLFKIYKNDPNVTAAAKVTYQGNVYSIATNDDSHSKIVLEYISTLLTFSKVPGSIPASPAVIIR
jgi:hypothetical protein